MITEEPIAVKEYVTSVPLIVACGLDVWYPHGMEETIAVDNDKLTIEQICREYGHLWSHNHWTVRTAVKYEGNNIQWDHGAKHPRGGHPRIMVRRSEVEAHLRRRGKM